MLVWRKFLITSLIPNIRIFANFLSSQYTNERYRDAGFTHIFRTIYHNFLKLSITQFNSIITIQFQNPVIKVGLCDYRILINFSDCRYFTVYTVLIWIHYVTKHISGKMDYLTVDKSNKCSHCSR